MQVVLSGNSVTFEKHVVHQGTKAERKDSRRSVSTKAKKSVSDYFCIRYCAYTNADGCLGTPVCKISKHSRPGDLPTHVIKLDKFINGRGPSYASIVPAGVKDKDWYATFFRDHVMQDIFDKHASHVKSTISLAFRRGSTQEGCANTGIYPFSVSKILSNCSSWVGMLASEHAKVYKAIEFLCSTCRQLDKVPERCTGDLELPGDLLQRRRG